MLGKDSEKKCFSESFLNNILGKKYAWLGEVILPFIEEKRLIKESDKCEKNDF